MERYEVIDYQNWRHDDGRTASIHGSCPWYTEAERKRWHLETSGYTVWDKRTNTYGIGRKEWKTRAEAESWVAGANHAYELAHRHI